MGQQKKHQPSLLSIFSCSSPLIWMLKGHAHPLPTTQGSAFHATQQEGEQRQEGRDAAGMCPKDSLVTLAAGSTCPELDFGGPRTHGTAGLRAGSITAKPVDSGHLNWHGPHHPYCRDLTPGGQPTLSPILSSFSSRLP